MISLLFIALILALAFLPQIWVSRAVKKGSAVQSSSNLTGREIAERILAANNITGIKIEHIPGNLTDHYDPGSKTVRLSDKVYDQRTVTASAIAAHEIGHVIQDHKGYLPLKLRSGIFPLAATASQVWIFVLFAGMLFSSFGLIWVALALYSAAVLFQLVTLPVEFDASRRAGAELKRLNLTAATEKGPRQLVLGAAAMTYVAAALASVLTLIYYASMFLNQD